MRVTNHHRSPITLEDGTILAAAGTPGATKDVVLSDKDRRHVGAGRLVILPDEELPLEGTVTVAGQTFAVTQTPGSEPVIAPIGEGEPAAEAPPSKTETPIGNLEKERPETKTRLRGGRSNV